RRQVEFHQRVDRLVGRVDDVHQAQMRADLELVARGLVDVRAAQHVIALDARRQGNRALYYRAGALGRIDDLQCGLVDQLVIKRLEANADFLTGKGHALSCSNLSKNEGPGLYAPSARLSC